jgi:hypothetical protein
MMKTVGFSVLLLLSGVAGAQTKGPPPPRDTPISTTPALYTDFDLFKNSGFGPCQTNTNTTAAPNENNFVVQRDVSTQQDFCSLFAGVPIMIPSLATQTAFFPWYPTLLIQAASLAVSYTGLFYTLRYVDRSRMRPSRRAPWHFWVQLPIDFARVVGFLFKAVHGFVDPLRFAWVNVLLWLLPLNYVYVASQMRSAEEANRTEEPYAGANQQLAQLRAQQTQSQSQSRTNNRSLVDQGFVREIGKEPGGGWAKARFAEFPLWRGSSLLPSDLRGRSARGATVWIWIVITAVMWFFSFVTMILHWKWAFSGGTSFTYTYTEITTALLDPRTVANMPVTCLTFLQTGALTRSDFMEQNTDQLMFSLIATLQFLFSTGVLAAVFLGRREPFDRAYLVLYTSAAVTMLLLLAPGFAAGIQVVTKVLVKKKVISVRFTNDLNATGGCTFAFVNMNKRFGYLDVAYEKGFRIVMSVLGAS